MVLNKILVPIGVGLVTIGVAIGMSKVGSSAIEGIARQPEAANKIQQVMFIMAGMIEGIALFALIICLMAK
ncbi:MAG: ATP synthase F0 subunit C [Candidatus Omnitrophica bacterium CG12_big_fil_rev_8_21_14_0_65_50_5]|nr:MAG: ATP synthase F0 subunit C [Candidatus Omnitrophica bacterium CG12_big_fil_rev_8_21_14_0_65_50_5]